MTSDDLPPDVLELLRGHVSSLVELDVLLCMRRHASTRWTATDLAEHLRLSDEWVVDALTALRAAGLVVKDEGEPAPRLRYHPITLGLEATVTALAEIYEERPASVARFLTERAITRVRRSASQAFPAAFVARTEDD